MPGTKKPETIFVKTQRVFTKKPTPSEKIAGATGICFLLKDFPADGETDFKKEAEELATFLRLVFPPMTLKFLKRHLPDVPGF